MDCFVAALLAMTASGGTPFTTLFRHREPGASRAWRFLSGLLVPVIASPAPAGRGDPADILFVDCFVAALLAMTASGGTPFTALFRHREPGTSRAWRFLSGLLVPVIASLAPAGRGDPAGFQFVDCFVAALLAMTEIVSGNYYVYILTNRRNGTLYTGITNSLERRVWQHQNKTAPGFTAKYGLGRLVYYEQFIDVSNAIAREKQIKAGSRAKKVALIEKENPEWKDLSAGWY